MLPAEDTSFSLDGYIEQLTKRHPDIESIWLIGSRANGNESATSDWDLIVFLGDKLFDDLGADEEVHRPEVDVLVVLSDGDEFRRPWGQPKTGSLSSWKWTQTGSDTANYVGTKWVPDIDNSIEGGDLGDIVSCQLHARRVWP